MANEVGGSESQAAADFPKPELDVDVLLSDGSTARFRPITPEDSEGLVEFHSRLSLETIARRFFNAHRRLSEEEVRHFTTLDGADRVSLVAQRGPDIVAVARYDRLPDGEVAEVAFVVEDRFQGIGLGTLLLERLVLIGRHYGIKRFVAYTLGDNYKMLEVFKKAGFASQSTRSEGVVKVVMDIMPTRAATEAAQERDRQAVVRSIGRLLKPRSIAVIGVSRKKGTIGREVVQNLISGEFGGPVYPVNPTAEFILSIPCWHSVEAIPGPVDLAIVAVPAEGVEEVVHSCGRKGVGGLIVITAGFAEAGSQGATEQARIARLAHGYGMRLVGPNCFGVITTDPEVSMNATFSARPPKAGNIGFASQSGGLGIAILAEIAERDIGLSQFVSMGNKADVSGNDLLQWWEVDPDTEVILLYLESMGNPKKFKRLAQRVSQTKPIVAVKSGRSVSGNRAARSHTAAMSSPEEAVDALFSSTGVIRVSTVEELFDAGELFSSQPLPAGDRVAIVCNAGGFGVLAADACSSNGLDVPELSKDLQRQLQDFLPSGAGLSNPVDLIASASAQTYRQACSLLCRSGEVDSVVVIFAPPLNTRAPDVAEALAQVAAENAESKSPVTLVASFVGSTSVRRQLRTGETIVPDFGYPENAIRALGHAARYSEWKRSPVGSIPELNGVSPSRGRKLIADASTSEEGWMSLPDAFEVLKAYGVPVIPSVFAQDLDQALGAVSEIGFPMAMKVVGPSILHKSDEGGVILGIEGELELRAAFETMTRTFGVRMHGVLLQPIHTGQVELIAGAVRYDKFGPVVLFGLGGVAAELTGDHVSRLAPITDLEAKGMVLGIRSSRLLTGYRGSETVDTAALEDILSRISQLMSDFPEISELDCNPVVASPDGALALDARIRLGSTLGDSESLDGVSVL